jgi:hypothetical protein
MHARAKHSPQHRAIVKRHRRRLTDRGQRLAASYYAVAKGMLWREPDGQPVALEWTGTSKRGGMRAAKAYARAFLEPGAIVELRATDAHGGIIERVELVARGLTAVRWRQAFET